MESQISLPPSADPATCTYTEPDYSSV